MLNDEIVFGGAYLHIKTTDSVKIANDLELYIEQNASKWMTVPPF